MQAKHDKTKALSNCKLCNSRPQSYAFTELYSCSNGACPMSKTRFSRNQWEVLNAPQVVMSEENKKAYEEFMETLGDLDG